MAAYIENPKNRASIGTTTLTPDDPVRPVIAPANRPIIKSATSMNGSITPETQSMIETFVGANHIYHGRGFGGMILRSEALTKSFGTKRVLSAVRLQINRGDAIGLVGRNGVGKSTLLKLLMGQISPDTGEMDIRTNRIGYLPQFPDLNGDEPVGQVVGTPAGDMMTITARMDELESLMTSGGDIDWNTVAEEYSRLEKEKDSITGVSLSFSGEKAMAAVGLGPELADRPMSQLRGGERTKVMLARVIVQAEGSDLLFMDEPTSHLDVETVEWLEDYLLKFDGGLVVVSHDRFFLDRVATSVADIDRGHLKRFKGNYTQFAEKKAMEVAKSYKASEKARIERDRYLQAAEDMYRRQRYSGEHKRLERRADAVEQIEKPRERNMKVRIEASNKSGKNVIMAKGISVSREGQMMVNSIDLDMMVGDKLGVFGPNGAGKSTLLKGLVGELPVDGDLWVAPGANIGYFAQGHDRLDPELTPEEQLMLIMGKDQRLAARQLLARFLITGELAERPISTLSGGERARVALAALMAEKRNLLILDEPTNYLDIPTRAAVEEALIEYPGTMLVVTHDRYFLDAVCNRVAELRDGKLAIYNGTYSMMRGSISNQAVEQAMAYRVMSGFTNWEYRRKHNVGDRIAIAPSEMKGYQWAIDQGKIKRIKGVERKKVSR